MKVRGWEKVFHANGQDGEAGVAILISDKIKAIKKDQERHYLMVKRAIQEEDTTIINIYVPNIGTPSYLQQILTDIKGEIDENTIIAETLTPHSQQWTDPLDRKSIRQQRP